MSKIIQKKARVVSNINLLGRYYKLSLYLPGVARVVNPGQFITLRVSEDYRPLLRRPFSIHKIGYRSSVIGRRLEALEAQRRNQKPDTIEILYEVVGSGTELLSQKKPCEYLDVLGPLGNSFDLRKLKTENHKPIIVAGGMGIAPLVFLVQMLTSYKSTQHTNHRPLVLIGARTKKEILFEKELARLGCSVKISTDDGSSGFKGRVTELLRHELSAISCQLSAIFACGPKPMLREVSVISKRHKIAAQVSLEAHMACGLGACLGCMVVTRKGAQFVCKDGPVFDAWEIKWYNRGK